MKLLVPTKSVPDTDQPVGVRGDGRAIETEALSFVINPFDAIAVEEAVRIRETLDPGAEIVAVSIGPERCEQELRTALAMGADRAILVTCDSATDPWNVARILCAVARRCQPELVLMGKQAVDDDANQTGQFLAALLGWPQATFASQLEFLDQFARVRVWRETDGGMETVVVGLPAVITTDLRLNEPRYASLPSLLRAKKKPLEILTLDELAITLEPRVQLHKLERVTRQRQCEQLNSVDELLDRLQQETKVI